jgi:hypothetical protein
MTDTYLVFDDVKASISATYSNEKDQAMAHAVAVGALWVLKTDGLLVNHLVEKLHAAESRDELWNVITAELYGLVEVLPVNVATAAIVGPRKGYFPANITKEARDLWDAIIASDRFKKAIVGRTRAVAYAIAVKWLAEACRRKGIDAFTDDKSNATTAHERIERDLHVCKAFVEQVFRNMHLLNVVQRQTPWILPRLVQRGNVYRIESSKRIVLKVGGVAVIEKLLRKYEGFNGEDLKFSPTPNSRVLVDVRPKNNDMVVSLALEYTKAQLVQLTGLPLKTAGAEFAKATEKWIRNTFRDQIKSVVAAGNEAARAYCNEIVQAIKDHKSRTYDLAKRTVVFVPKTALKSERHVVLIFSKDSDYDGSFVNVDPKKPTASGAMFRTTVAIIRKLSEKFSADTHLDLFSLHYEVKEEQDVGAVLERSGSLRTDLFHDIVFAIEAEKDLRLALKEHEVDADLVHASSATDQKQRTRATAIAQKVVKLIRAGKLKKVRAYTYSLVVIYSKLLGLKPLTIEFVDARSDSADVGGESERNGKFGAKHLVIECDFKHYDLPNLVDAENTNFFTTLEHEIIHMLDTNKTLSRDASSYNSRIKLDVDNIPDFAKYFNTPEEFNAYLQSGISAWARSGDAEALQKPFPEFYNAFKQFWNNKDSQDQAFWKSLTPERERRAINRLYSYWSMNRVTASSNELRVTDEFEITPIDSGDTKVKLPVGAILRPIKREDNLQAYQVAHPHSVLGIRVVLQPEHHQYCSHIANDIETFDGSLLAAFELLTEEFQSLKTIRLDGAKVGKLLGPVATWPFAENRAWMHHLNAKSTHPALTFETVQHNGAKNLAAIYHGSW